MFQYSDIQIKALLFLYDYMSNMTGYLFRDRNCYFFAGTLVHPRFFVGVRVVHLFSYLCCVLVLFAFAVCTSGCLCLWIVRAGLPLSDFSKVYLLPGISDQSSG